MNQAFDFESGAKYACYSFFLGYIVAQRNDKPAWNAGDFFWRALRQEQELTVSRTKKCF